MYITVHRVHLYMYIKNEVVILIYYATIFSFWKILLDTRRQVYMYEISLVVTVATEDSHGQNER